MCVITARSSVNIAPIANTLVAQGAKVAGTATSESGAAKISDYLGDNGKGYALNVTDPASIEATLAAIKADLGDIDVLVNNAGITRDNLLMRMKENEWDDDSGRRSASPCRHSPH